MQNSLHWSFLIFEAQNGEYVLEEDKKTFKIMPLLFGNVQKGSKCSDVHIMCVRDAVKNVLADFVR